MTLAFGFGICSLSTQENFDPISILSAFFGLRGHQNTVLVVIYKCYKLKCGMWVRTIAITKWRAYARSLLANNALKIGQNLKFDWQMLLMAGLPLSPPFFDTYLAGLVLTAGLKTSLSLDAIADKLLNIKLDKSPQKSNFAGQLSKEQLLYAATDAAIILPLYHKLKGLLAKAKLTRSVPNKKQRE